MDNSESLNLINDRIKRIEQRQYIVRFILKVITLIILITFLFQVIFGLVIVRGNGMSPLFQDGDLALFIRLKSNYIVGDIVVIEKEGDKQLVRIVAQAGDEVDISKAGEFSVNGNIQYGHTEYPTFYENNDMIFPYVISDNQFFVLNDYRENDRDSREYDAINENEIQGKIFSLFRSRIY